ncbi:MAG: hypothetical protein R3A10_09865 [Caldilineaceae bacterium]
MLLATGLLSHYEAALTGCPRPSCWACSSGKSGCAGGGIAGATVIGGVVGVVLLALFYVPFVRHPQFSATYTYLSDRRMGGQFPAQQPGRLFPAHHGLQHHLPACHPHRVDHRSHRARPLSARRWARSPRRCWAPSWSLPSGIPRG